jgi:hypothetical protein
LALDIQERIKKNKNEYTPKQQKHWLPTMT